MLSSRRSKVVAGGVAAAVLAVAAVVVAVTHDDGSDNRRDLLAASVDVVGCPHPEKVQVRVRQVQRSVRTPAGTGRPLGPSRQQTPPPRPRPSVTATPSPSASASPTAQRTTSPTPVPTAVRTPSPTPSPTASPLPTRTLPPRPTPTRTGKPVAPLRAQAEVVTPLPVDATVHDGRYELTGLTKGELYQVGAKVPGCAGKLVVPAGGFFVAGVTQAPPVAVVKPVQARRQGATVTWDSGSDGARWTLSTGDAPQSSCKDPSGVVASGHLRGGKGTFAFDAQDAAKKAQQTATSSTLHLRVVHDDTSCAPSSALDVPLVLGGLDQTGSTQLQVYDAPKLLTTGYGSCDICQPGLYDPYLWQGSSAFDWDDPAVSTRPFHWSSTSLAAAKGRWELSSTLLADSCKPSGVLASGEVGYAKGPLSDQSTGSPPNFTVDLRGRGLDHGTAYFLRVVPLTKTGACAGPPSAPVILTWQAKGGVTVPVPNPPPAFAHLDTSFVSFQKLVPEVPSPPYCFIALADHTVTNDFTQISKDVVGFAALGPGKSVAKGQEVCFSPTTDDDSFWDSLASVVDFVLDVVSFPAKVYEEFQQIIPSILGELIPGCEKTCKQAILIAEKAALVAVGLPPSLPDANRLVQDGEDYLVQQVAEETGVPEVVVQAAYDKGKQAIADQLAATSAQQTGLTCDWCAFDNGVRAPALKVVVSRPSWDDASLPLPYRVCVTNTASPHAKGASTQVAEPLFLAGCVNVPKSFPPGSSLTVPVSLTPNIAPIRQYVQQLFYDSKSQLGGSESQLDNQAFAAWKGQQGKTSSVTFAATPYGRFDAGPSFGQQDAPQPPSTATFPMG